MDGGYDVGIDNGGRMSKRKVFVIWNHPLFFESVRLLLQDSSIEWVGSCHICNDTNIQVAGIYPDTILIEEIDGGVTPARVLELLEIRTPHLRIFRLNLNDNDLQIYHKEQRTVMQSDDLLQLIRGGK